MMFEEAKIEIPSVLPVFWCRTLIVKIQKYSILVKLVSIWFFTLNNITILLSLQAFMKSMGTSCLYGRGPNKKKKRKRIKIPSPLKKVFLTNYAC